MLRTGRLIGWGTSLYGLTEEEIGIVEEGKEYVGIDEEKMTASPKRAPAKPLEPAIRDSPDSNDTERRETPL